MEKEVIRTLLGTCAIGSLCVLASYTSPLSGIGAFDRGESPPVSLDARKVYDLRVLDETRYDLKRDSLTWWVRPYGDDALQGFYLNDNVREHAFADTGRYVVSAYKHMREIARDTFVVVEGEKFEWAGPDATTDTVGAVFLFTDYSQQARSTEWLIAGPQGDLGSSVPAPTATSNEPEFEWRPQLPGTYTAYVKVEFASGRVEHDSTLITVMAPAARPMVDVKPPLPTPIRPRRQPRPRIPAPTPAPPPSSTAAFGIETTRFTGTTKVEIEIPDRKKVTNYKSTEVTFTMTPPSDCVLDHFSYFTKSRGSRVAITITCETPGRTGAPFSRSFDGGFDAFTATVHSMANMPVLFKGVKYRISIRPVEGEMGYFPIDGNKFGVVDEHGTRKLGQGNIQFTSDSETCLFDVVFRAAQ